VSVPLRIALAAAVGVLMAWLGVVSDNVPFTAAGHGLAPQVGWGVAGFANDIVTWFVAVMLVARLLLTRA
jgi:hypothetical protein